VCKGNSASNAALTYCIDVYTGSKLGFNIGNGATYNFLQSNTILQTYAWQHVVGVADGSTMKVYINGVMDNSVGQTISPYNSDQPLLMGALTTSGYRFNGMIDEVRVYNRALTQREIINDMNSGLTRHGLYQSSTAAGDYAPLYGLGDTFDDGNYNGWTVGLGSWAVTNSKLEQTTATGETRIYTSMALEGYTDYVINVDLTATAAGQAVIVWNDADGSTYDTVEAYFGSNSICIEGEICSYDTTFNLNEWHNIKVYVLNTHQAIRVVVDGQPALYYAPVTYTEDGMVGLGTYGTAAKYDNFKVTPLSFYDTPSFYVSGFTDTVAPPAPGAPGVTAPAANQLSVSWSPVTDLGSDWFHGIKTFDFMLNENNYYPATPVSYWDFSEAITGSRDAQAASDKVGTNHGTVTGALGGAGKYGGGLWFDGSDDHVEVLHSAIGNPTGSFTVAGWAKRTGSRGGTGSIISKHGVTTGYSIEYNFDSSLLQAAVNDGSNWNTIYGGAWNIGEWHFAVLRYDDVTDTLSLFDNAVFKSSMVEAAPVYSTHDLWFGNSEEYTTNDWPGSIDEVYYYTRALSDEEIASLYLRGEVKKSSIASGIWNYDLTGTGVSNPYGSTPATISGLTENTQYCYTVKARDNSNNLGSASGSGCGWTLPKNPAFTITDTHTVSTCNTADSKDSTVDIRISTSTPAAGFHYVWDKTSNTPVTTGNTAWDGLAQTFTATSDGDWYLHAISKNADGALNPGGTQHFGPFKIDTTAPTPNPATFLVPPTGGANQVTMVATTASDTGCGNTAITYYFTETTHNSGWTDSGWQSSSSYLDTVLSTATQYCYTIQYKDGATNTGTASSASCAYTSTAVPTMNAPTENGASLDSQLGRVSLSWSSSNPGGTEYDVQRVNDLVTVCGPTTSMSCTDTTAPDNTVVRYKARARPPAGSWGSYSSEQQVTTFDRTGPTTPTITATADNVNNKVDLSWVQPESGLLAYWPFEAGGTDRSGNGKTGTINFGMPTGGNTNPYTGSALDCSASNAVMTVTPTVDIAAAWTITSWFYYPLATADSYNTLTRGQAEDHQIIVQRGANQFLGTYINGGGAPGFYNTGFDMHMLPNGWHHIAAIGSGGQTVFYIDGSQVGTAAAQSQSDIFAVCNYQGGTQPWGIVDEVKVYGRALTQREIVDTMQSGLTEYGPYQSSTTTGTFKPLGGFADSFDRAPLGSDWASYAGTWSISSNQMYGTAAATGTSNDAYYTGTLASQNYVLEANVKGDSWTHLTFRVQNINNYYYFWMGPDVIIAKVVGGGYSEPYRKTNPIGWSANTWYRMKVALNGNSVKAYINDIQVWDVTLTDLSTGSVGVGLYGAGSSIYVDDLHVTPLLATTTYSDTSAKDTTAPATPGTPTPTTSGTECASSSTCSLSVAWAGVSDNGNTYYYYGDAFDDESNWATLWINNGGFEKDTTGYTAYSGNTMTLQSANPISGYNYLDISGAGGALISPNPVPDTLLYGIGLLAKVGSGTLSVGNGNVAWWGQVTNAENGNLWKRYVFVKEGGSSDGAYHFGTYGGQADIDDIRFYKVPSATVTTDVKDYYITGTGTGANAWGAASPQAISGLTANTQYCYTVKAEDKATPANVGSPSAVAGCQYTLAVKPSIASVVCSGSGSYQCSVSFNMNGNPGGTNYYITASSNDSGTGSTDSGWVSAASPYVDTGLQAHKTFCYNIKARNSAGTPVETTATAPNTCTPVPNNAPTTPSGSTLNAGDQIGEVLTAAGAGSTDPDGDTVSFKYQFRCDDPVTGAILQAKSTTASWTIANTCGKGHTVYVLVWGFDGTAESASYQTLTKTIINTAPTTPAGSTLNTANQVGQTLTATGAGGTDVDTGDTVSYKYEFRCDSVSGTILQAKSTTASWTISNTCGKSHANGIFVLIWAYDGTAESASYQSLSRVVVNSAPTPPSGSTLNTADQVGETLTATGAGATDPDADSITYSYRFNCGSAGGTEMQAKSTTASWLVSSSCGPGQTVYVSIWASDGTAENPTTEVKTRFIEANTPAMGTVTPQSDKPLNSRLGKMAVTWTANSNPGGAEYEVQRDQTTTVYGPGTATAYTDDNLNDGTQYCYRARARVAGGASTWSSYTTDSCATTPDRTPPTAPTLTVAMDAVNYNIDLDWTATASKYAFWRMKDSFSATPTPLGNGVNDEFEPYGPGPLMPPWAQVSGSWEITSFGGSNTVRNSAPATPGMAVISPPSTTDYIVEANIYDAYPLANDPHPGIIVAYQDANNYDAIYLRDMSDEIVQYQVRVGNPSTPVIKAGEPIPSNDWVNLKVVKEGTAARVYLNDKYMGTATVLSNPGVGLWYYTSTGGATAYFDGFRTTPLYAGTHLDDAAATDTAAPATPTAPALAADSTTQLTLSWTAPSDSGNAYYYYQDAFDAENNWASIGIANSGFEKDLTGWNQVGGVTATRTAGGLSGNYYLDLTGGSAGVYITNPVTTVGVYAVTFWAKVETGTLTVGNLNYAAWGTVTAAQNGNTWRKYTIINNGAPGDAWFHVYNTGGHAMVDEFHFYKVPTATVASGMKDYYVAGTNANTYKTASPYPVTGLSTNTQYCYTAAGRDNALNTGSATSSLCKYTLAAQPSITGATGSGSYGTYQCSVAFSMGANPGTTQHYIRCASGACNSYNWGTAASPYVDTVASKGAYTYAIKAKNGDGTETAETSPTTCTVANNAPALTSVAAGTEPILGGNTQTITASGQADNDRDPLTMYCCFDQTPGTPCNPVSQHDETSGSVSWPYSPTQVTHATPAASGLWYARCAITDGTAYTSAVSTSFNVDYTAPTLVGYTVTGCTYTQSGADSYCWTKNGVITHHFSEYSDNSAQMGNNYLTFTENGCGPNGCGASAEIKSYYHVTSGGFVDWLVDDTKLNIVGAACAAGHTSCSDTDAKTDFTVNTTNSASEVRKYKVWTFQYDKVGLGQGYNYVNWWLGVDNEAPTTTETPTQSGAWTNADVPSVTLTGNDGTGSGIASGYPKYCTGACTPSTTYSTPLSFTCGTGSVCQSVLKFQSADNVGITESVVTKNINIDKKAPTTTDNANTAWVNSDQTVTLTPADSGSGVASTVYCTDSGGICAPGTSGTSISVTCASGQVCQTHVRYKSTDSVGNAQDVVDKLVRIDKTVPSTGDNAPTAWQANDVMVTLTPADTGSDVANTYSCVDTTGTTCTPTTTGTSVSVTCAGGSTCPSKYVRYYSMDVAGNTEGVKVSGMMRIDKQAPTITMLGAPADWTKNTQSASTSCSDGSGSGCATLKLYVSPTSVATCPSTWSSYGSASPQSVTLHSWICAAANDSVGNTGYQTLPSNQAVEFKVDQVAPPAVTTTPLQYYKTGYPTISWGAVTDTGGSGTKCYYGKIANNVQFNLNPGTTQEIGWAFSCVAGASYTIPSPAATHACSVTGGTAGLCDEKWYVKMWAEDNAGNAVEP
jgi:hypothetical protein